MSDSPQTIVRDDWRSQWQPSQPPQTEADPDVDRMSTQCPDLTGGRSVIYSLKATGNDVLSLPFTGELDLELINTADWVPHFTVDGQECQPTSSYTADGCYSLIWSWPRDNVSTHTLVIAAPTPAPAQGFDHIHGFELLVMYERQQNLSYGDIPTTSIPSTVSVPVAIPTSSTSVHTTGGPSAVPGSDSGVSHTPVAAVRSGGSTNVRVIVPAVVVPVVVIIILAAVVAFLWRRRTRTKMAPSAAFKMENPTFTPGETWVPIDEKRAFSPGPTKVGSGSSL